MYDYFFSFKMHLNSNILGILHANMMKNINALIFHKNI